MTFGFSLALALVACGKLDEGSLDASLPDASRDATVGCTYLTVDGAAAFCPLGAKDCPARDGCNACSCFEGDEPAVACTSTLPCPNH